MSTATPPKCNTCRTDIYGGSYFMIDGHSYHNECINEHVSVGGLREDIRMLTEELTETRKDNERLAANLRLARAGMPGLGVVEFDSNQTAELREKLFSAESQLDAARQSLANIDHVTEEMERINTIIVAERDAIKVDVTRLTEALEHARACLIAISKHSEEKSTAILATNALEDIAAIRAGRAGKAGE